jgi:Tfp pilus assembly protein PilW
MSRIDSLRDERGTTMVEVLVATATGLIVLSALTTVIVVTLHGTARTNARIEATQRARIVVSQIMQELHSACVSPKIAPIQAESSGTLLKFIHASAAEGSVVAPAPTLTEISLSGGVLTQTDRASTGGTAPNWTYSATTTTRRLLTKVAPISPSTSIFTYYASASGAVSSTPQEAPLVSTTAPLTVQVRVALAASPNTTPAIDKHGAASIQDSATLRLTPPSFNENAASLPCQ